MLVSQEVKNLIKRKLTKSQSLLKSVEAHDKEYGTNNAELKGHLTKLIDNYHKILEM